MHWHAKTVTLPIADTAFAGQPLHTILAPVEYVFAGQSVHAVESVTALYLPAAQAVHVKLDCNMYPDTHLHVSSYTL
jgi:hypothetical protein